MAAKMAAKQVSARARASNIFRTVAAIVGISFAAPGAAGGAFVWPPSNIVTNLPSSYVLSLSGAFVPGYADYFPIWVPTARAAKGIAFSAGCNTAANYRVGLYASDPSTGELAAPLKADAGQVTIAGNGASNLTKYNGNFHTATQIYADTVVLVAIEAQHTNSCFFMGYEPNTVFLKDGGPIFFQPPSEAGTSIPTSTNGLPTQPIGFAAQVTYGPWMKAPPHWTTGGQLSGGSIPIFGIY